jgi:hypothetical protein
MVDYKQSQNIILSSFSNKDLVKFLDYFSVKSKQYASLFELTDQELADVQNDLRFWQWLSQIEQDTRHAVEHMKQHTKSMRISTYFENPMPLSLQKINLIPPVQVKPALHRRYKLLFDKIRNNPAFTTEIAIDMGLTGDKWR